MRSIMNYLFYLAWRQEVRKAAEKADRELEEFRKEYQSKTIK